jgi:hypothetical protein
MTNRTKVISIKTYLTDKEFDLILYKPNSVQRLKKINIVRKNVVFKH